MTGRLRRGAARRLGLRAPGGQPAFLQLRDLTDDELAELRTKFDEARQATRPMVLRAEQALLAARAEAAADLAKLRTQLDGQP